MPFLEGDATCFGADCDKVFAYPTVKLVKIQDRRLGLLHYAVLFSIFVYIVIFEMAYCVGYLNTVQATGTVRFSLRQPTTSNQDPENPDFCDPVEYEPNCVNTLPPISTLDYCSQSEVDPVDGQVQFPCQYYDFAEDQSVGDTTVLISTYVELAFQNRTCDRSIDFTEDCPKIWETLPLPGNPPLQPGNPSLQSYVVAPEKFSLLIDHTCQSSTLGIFQNSAIMKGKLFVPNNSTLCSEDSTATTTAAGSSSTSEAPCYITPNDAGGLDFFYVETLLAASDTLANDIREDGTVLTLTVEYSNVLPWSGPQDEVTYVYKLDSAPKSKYKEVVIDRVSADQQTRTVRKLYGIQIAVVFSGKLGQFDFAQLLITATTALALLAMATTVVDALAVYAMPLKEHYADAKYQITEDFSDMQKRLLEEEEQNMDRGNGLGAPSLNKIE